MQSHQLNRNIIVVHKRLVLRMVTMSKPGNYDLSDWMYVMCGITLPVSLYIYIFFTFQLQKILKVVN